MPNDSNSLQKLDYRAIVADYDAAKNYFYRDFWHGREYEHLAEVTALYRIFGRFVLSKTGSLLDLGGAYGRLIPITQEFFKTIVLGDYSLKELQDFRRANINIKSDLNLYRVALNAYALPFVDDIFDTVMSVRVMHHINTPRGMFTEVYRVLKPGGIFVLEFAHKNHIKAVVRALVRGNWSFFNRDVIKQKHNPKTAQGVVDASRIIFNNFSLDFILKTLKGVGFDVKFIQPVSFLRLPVLKRLFRANILLKVERVLQEFRFLRITPSIFLVAQKPELVENKRELNIEEFDLYKVLRCPDPIHNTILERQENLLLCKGGDEYPIIDGVPDLRYPRPLAKTGL